MFVLLLFFALNLLRRKVVNLFIVKLPTLWTRLNEMCNESGSTMPKPKAAKTGEAPNFFSKGVFFTMVFEQVPVKCID